jgi:hypothetical protein
MKSLKWVVITVALFLAGCSKTEYKGSSIDQNEVLDTEEFNKQLMVLSEAGEVGFSDYFSFVGRDERGVVAFAIDNNRSRSAQKYEAEHFLVFYDSDQGYIEIPGYSGYENQHRELVEIPDSKFFTFKKTDNDTLEIKSLARDLSLTIEEVSPVLQSIDDLMVNQMGVANAQLAWNGRVISGRIIHERLAVQNHSKAKKEWFWHNVKGGAFHGLYLMAEDGSDIYVRASDFLIHSIESSPVEGFTSNKGDTHIIRENSEFLVSEKAQGPGLFRWPTAWEAQWGEQSVQSLKVIQIHKKNIKTWVVGGFAMTYVEGTWTKEDGSSVKVYGFAEIIL